MGKSLKSQVNRRNNSEFDVLVLLKPKAEGWSTRVQSQWFDWFENESYTVSNSHIKCSFVCQEQVDIIKKKSVCVHVHLCVSMCGCASLSVQCVKCSPYSHVAGGDCGWWWWWWWLYQVYAWSCLSNLTQRRSHHHNNSTPFPLPLSSTPLTPSPSGRPPPPSPPPPPFTFSFYLSPSLPILPLTAITALTDGEKREMEGERKGERGGQRENQRGIYKMTDQKGRWDKKETVRKRQDKMMAVMISKLVYMPVDI